MHSVRGALARACRGHDALVLVVLRHEHCVRLHLLVLAQKAKVETDGGDVLAVVIIIAWSFRSCSSVTIWLAPGPDTKLTRWIVIRVTFSNM